MKSTDLKFRFVELRATNMSLSAIANELHISRSTCTKWDKDLKEQVNEQKAVKKETLVNLYEMDRQHRIDRLCHVLQRLDAVIDNMDLSMMSPDNLLKMKLRYEAELAKELLIPHPVTDVISSMNDEAALKRLTQLLAQYESGKMSKEQMKVCLSALDMIWKIVQDKNKAWSTGKEKTESLPYNG